MLERPMDQYGLMKNGWAQSSLDRSLADLLLRRLQAATWRPAPSDHCDAGPRELTTFDDGSMEKDILNDLLYRMLEEDLPKINDLYRHREGHYFLSGLRLGSGYSLDWHNHLAAGPALTILIYLFDEGDPGEGGDLVIGEIGEDFDQNAPKELMRFSPRHGDVIIIGDSSHPLQVHKAELWKGRGKRYIISFGFNGSDW